MKPESMEQVDVEAQGLVLCQKATRFEEDRECSRRLEAAWMWVGVLGKDIELSLAGDLKGERVL